MHKFSQSLVDPESLSFESGAESGNLRYKSLAINSVCRVCLLLPDFVESGRDCYQTLQSLESLLPDFADYNY